MRKLLLVALFTAGCGFQWEPLSPSNTIEDLLISETARYAGMMGVKVHGEMTDDLTKGQKLQEPLAFYDSGIAWYYRPLVQQHVTIENGNDCPSGTCLRATDVAAHEVCHAKHPLHDLAHWECSNKWAVPTYPRP